MEFEYQEKTYSLTKLNVMEQFNLSRKLLPILSGMQSALTSGGDEMEIFAKVSESLSKMSDDEAKSCIFGFLKSVKRKSESGLNSVCANDAIMYADIDLTAMLFLVFKSIQFNLSDFFVSLPRLLQDANLKQSDQ